MFKDPIREEKLLAGLDSVCCTFHEKENKIKNVKIEKEKRTSVFDKFKCEKERLLSFGHPRVWPKRHPTPEKLAKFGFYFTQFSDSATCAFCFTTLMEWQNDDSPLFEHKKFSPKCPFINGKDVGNIPLNIDPMKNDF